MDGGTRIRGDFDCSDSSRISPDVEEREGVRIEGLVFHPLLNQTPSPH